MLAAALVGVSLGSAVVSTPKLWQVPPPAEPIRLAAAAPAPTMAPLVPEVPPTPRAQPQPQPVAETVKVEPAAKPVRTERAKPRRARAGHGHSGMMAADRRLRRAYAQASRAGVDRPVLVSYRNRWASLRRRASDEPARLIRGYANMADDLENLARDARAAQRRA